MVNKQLLLDRFDIVKDNVQTFSHDETFETAHMARVTVEVFNGRQWRRVASSCVEFDSDIMRKSDAKGKERARKRRDNAGVRA